MSSSEYDDVGAYIALSCVCSNLLCTQQVLLL